MGLPVGLAGMLIFVEALIDMGRTAFNINGSMIAGTLTSKILGSHNVEKFNDKKPIDNVYISGYTKVNKLIKGD